MAGSYISVAEAAARLGVHPQRVHQRIRDGSLEAEKIGHQWAVDLASVQRVEKRIGPGRPLSAKSAWDLIAVAMAQQEAPGAAAELSPSSRSRARSRLRNLLAHSTRDADLDDVAALVAHLLRNRAQRRLYVASPRDLPDIRVDRRVHLSGISLPRSNMSSGDVVEGYIVDSDLRPLADDYLLSPASRDRANVILHVVAADHGDLGALDLGDVARSALALAADLVEHGGAREKREAVRLLDDLDELLADNADGAVGRGARAQGGSRAGAHQ